MGRGGGAEGRTQRARWSLMEPYGALWSLMDDRNQQHRGDLKRPPPKIYGQWSVSGEKNLELSQWSSVVMEMLNFRSVWELVLVVMG